MAAAQLDLLTGVPARPRPGFLAALDAEVRAGLSDMLKRYPGSRYEVAARVSELLLADVSKPMLDAYTADSRETHCISLVRFVAVVIATGDVSVLERICELTGGRYLKGEDIASAELGQIERELADLARRKRDLKSKVRGRR